MIYKCKLLNLLGGILIYFIMLSSVSASTSFVAVGHLYPIIDDKTILNKLFNKIESLNPEYIFILGDSSLQEKEVYDYLYKRFQEKIFFVPGNHEQSNGTFEKYKNNVGYINKVVETDDIKFILLNSSDSLINIKKFLINVLKNDTNKIQIILTHHRLWDDSLTSQYANQHDKSYYFKDIYPILSGKIKAIFAGNSKRQYFEDYTQMGLGALQNVNNIFWVDQVGDINGYSIGTGDGKPKLGFVYVKEINGNLLVNPHHITTDGSDPVSIDKIRKTLNSKVPDSYISDIRLMAKIKDYYEKASKKMMFVVSIATGFFVILIFYISRLLWIRLNEHK
jgi:calcineurin-like phosphoesterase family protein